MGMVMHNKNWKLCGTCEYWVGSRTVDQFSNYVTFDESSKGKCMAPVGPWRNNSEMHGRLQCHAWKKWSILK